MSVDPLQRRDLCPLSPSLSTGSGCMGRYRHGAAASREPLCWAEEVHSYLTTKPSEKDRKESRRQVPPLATAPKTIFSPQINPFTYKMNTQTKLSKWVSHFLIEYICQGSCSGLPHTCPWVAGTWAVCFVVLKSASLRFQTLISECLRVLSCSILFLWSFSGKNEQNGAEFRVLSLSASQIAFLDLLCFALKRTR